MVKGQKLPGWAQREAAAGKKALPQGLSSLGIGWVMDG